MTRLVSCSCHKQCDEKKQKFAGMLNKQAKTFVKGFTLDMMRNFFFSFLAIRLSMHVACISFCSSEDKKFSVDAINYKLKASRP